MSVWFKYSGTPNYSTIVSKPFNGPAWSYPYVSDLIRLNNTSSVEFDVGNGSTFSAFAPGYPTSAGVWYYAVQTYDGTNLSAYLNGALVGTSTAVSGNIAYDGAGSIPWIVGADYGASPYGGFL